MEKSNITITSNIYPISNYKHFFKYVEGKQALEILNKNGIYVQDRDFTKIQEEQWKYGMKCFYNEVGDLTWGLIKDNGNFEMKCRCIETSCKNFNKCRPNFNNNELKHVILKLNIKEELISTMNKEISREMIAPTILGLDIKVKDLLIDDIKNNLNENTSEQQKDLDTTGVKEIMESVIIHKETEVKEIEQKRNVVDQEYVIKAPRESKILVNAGPGTGKTYTLIERLKYLTDKCGINAAEEMMVLCFSRAAVAEVRNRIKKAIESGEVNDDLRFIDIRTFDSFATYLLYETNDKVDLTGLKYDDRIKASTKIIKKQREIFSNFKHFIVDEIQDLVGERALLVQEILKSLECGFTLLGDSCQAIYDYQIETSKETDSKKFYEWLNTYFENNLQTLEFSENHRQTESLSKFANNVRVSILNNNSDENKKEMIKHSLDTIVKLGDISCIKNKIVKAEGTTCFLCRNNGEVQKLSQYLRNLELNHSVQKAAINKLLEPWIGRILGNYEYETMDYYDFKETILKYRKFNDYDIEHKWNLILAISQTNSSRISLKDFVDNLVKDVSLSGDLYITDISNIVVSTIHRAKGREYDRVILLEDSIISVLDREYDSKSLTDELKTFYVSITRPKNELLLTKFKRKSYLQSINNSERRWVETNKFSKLKHKNIAFLEIGKEADVDGTSFIDLNTFNDEESVFNNQKYVIENINKGDELTLRKFIDFDGNDKYKILHNNKTIGNMSNNFTHQLRTAIKQVQGFCYDLPIEIQQVYVDEIITYITKDCKEHVPKIYSRTRLWNGISVSGFGFIKWKQSDL